MSRQAISIRGRADGPGIIRIWYPPPSEGCTTVTAADVIAAAAEEGIALSQPDPNSAWLVDDRGRPVFWWPGDDALVLRTFPYDPSHQGTPNAPSYTI